MRQIVLDTETTGLEWSQGDRVIEIGCVELVDRRPTGNNFHQYLNPDREVPREAVEVHGITNDFLADKPRFHEVAERFVEYIRGSELVIHNAAFDVGFLNYELSRLGRGWGRVEDFASVLDTLLLARQRHPGQRNSLDALCKRYDVDNTQRELHGALLDARILADVYLAMTGGQKALFTLDEEEAQAHQGEGGGIRRLPSERPRLAVVRAGEAERRAHEVLLDRIDKASGGGCRWRRTEVAGDA
ncbi:DNA polymerase III subunit epsilon [Alkalilimnicola ehrlichii]|uniref:DNA polymerase III subunit epsilon n=1 Tax=Alkalilimnicola ehrlichii TaxID=351052 RepID=UPI003B9F1163